jgi:hypothetical protein
MKDTSQPLYRIAAKVWLHQGKAAWHFVTLPKDQSAAIRWLYGGAKRGWGSLPVTVTIRETRWTTSIFPDRKAGAYLLPLKADIRKKENIRAGDTLRLKLEVRA